MLNVNGDRNKVSVIIPAYNEAEFIEDVVEKASAVEEVDEVVVVDDGSTDGTSAKVKGNAKLVRLDTNCGKGAALKEGVSNAKGDILVFLDADLMDIKREKIQRLIHAIEDNDLVVARFDRRGGRVTELTAKPLLNHLFPEIDLEQPLSGQRALKRDLFYKMDFPRDYGVDIAMLIDAYMHGAEVGEVNFGKLNHDMKPLDELKSVAEDVNTTILKKAEDYGRIVMSDEIRD